MRKYPHYHADMAVTRRGFKFTLTAMSKCGEKIKGTGTDRDPDIAESEAFVDLTAKNTMSRYRCAKKGRHDSSHE